MIYFAIFARLLFLAYLIIVAWQVVVLYKEIVALIGQFFSQSESWNIKENENKHSDRHNLAWILLLGLLGFLFEFFHSIFIRRGLSTFFVREYSWWQNISVTDFFNELTLDEFHLSTTVWTEIGIILMLETNDCDRSVIINILSPTYCRQQ